MKFCVINDEKTLLFPYNFINLLFRIIFNVTIPYPNQPKNTPSKSLHVWSWAYLATPNQEYKFYMLSLYRKSKTFIACFQRYWWIKNSAILLGQSTFWFMNWICVYCVGVLCILVVPRTTQKGAGQAQNKF